MVNSRFTVLLSLLIVHRSMQKSDPASSTYKAAVVEFRPVMYLSDALRTLNANADKSVKFIEQAAIKDADIIVFPELNLPTVKFIRRPYTDSWSTLIPDPSENYSGCTNFSIPISEALRKIACAARRNEIYAVVNVVEKVTCSGEQNCANDGVFYYVSNVAFDRNGIIISRARKGHLFDEHGIINTLPTPEYSIFHTDFGVTFGNIVCFDIMYEDPALTQTRDLNITDIIYTSGWFNTMPFLTTIQMEAGWAYAEDVNMLAGGYNKIDQAYSGTGIYAGRDGIVAAIIPMNDSEELLIAEVKKKSRTTRRTPISPDFGDDQLRSGNDEQENGSSNESKNETVAQNYLWLYEDLSDLKHKVITGNGPVIETLNHNGLECEYRMNVTDLKPPLTYDLLIFNGEHQLGSVTVLGVRICAIVQCANDTINSCGHVRDSSVTLNNVNVTATYVDNGRTLMMPNTLGTDMLTLKNFGFNKSKRNERISEMIYTTAPAKNLVTFGFWGRNFEIDRLVYTPSMRIV